MHGIASLLDSDHNQQVEELWAELAKECRVSGAYVTPYPHFSYQIASCYDTERLESILQRFCANKAPLRIKTCGLGIFTARHPVLYIPVVRSPELTYFHASLWQETVGAGWNVQEDYHPDRWMPHITLGIGDLNRDRLSRAVRLLAERDFNWEITINNVVMIYDTVITPFGTTLLGDQMWYSSIVKKIQTFRLNAAHQAA